ncbi:sulfurtransferase-like selenium metabolism protein YedF [Sulfurospirillum sp. 1307]
MKIDCRNLACPEPVIQTKKALDSLPDDSILEVLVNAKSSVENVERFAKKGGFTVSYETKGEDTLITIVKGFACGIPTKEDKSEFLDKVVFIKDDKVGEGELGSKLVVGFIKSILELPKLPKTLIFVNKGVLLTTADEDSEIINILKEIEQKGVEIFSCGVCLDFYNVADKLRVGMVGNAYGTVESLVNSEGTISL